MSLSIPLDYNIPKTWVLFGSGVWYLKQKNHSVKNYRIENKLRGSVAQCD